MRKKWNKFACIWAVGAVVALGATIMNSCSSDDDYDLYQGDELKTYAAATRAGTESGGVKVYTYSFKITDSRTATETISAANDFTASVKFSWIGGSDAKSADITVDCNFSNPTRTYMAANGDIVERPLYTIEEWRNTKVLPNIGHANVYSSLTTDLTVEYNEISYDSEGNRTGSIRSVLFIPVTVDITDCIEAKYTIIK